MISITALNFIFAFIFASLTAMLFLGQEKNATRTYALVSLCITGWAIGLGSYFFVSDPYWLIFWNRYNHLLAGLIAITFFYFALIFPNKARPSRAVQALLVIIELVFLFLYFYTDVIITDSHLLNLAIVLRYPDLFFAVGPYFYLHFFGFFGLGFIALWRTMRETLVPSIKLQTKYLLYGTILGVIPPIVVDIILPRFNIYAFYGYAGALIVGWVAFTAYAIAKHQLFNVRLVLTSIAASSVVSIAGILALEAATNPGESLGLAGRIALFVAFSIVGVFLLYSLKRGEERRSQLARLESNLKTMNQDLTSRVAERSARLREERQHVDQILEELVDGLVELDSNFRVLRINKAAQQILGVTENDVLNRPITPHDAAHDELEALTRITFPGGASQHVTYSTRQGVRAAVTEVAVSRPQPREIEVATITFGSVISGTSYIKILRDITAEKEIARNKSAFITTAAHRLRTPLSSSKWALDAFVDGSMGRLTKKQHSSLVRMKHTNESMIRLVNALLNSAHIEEGRYGFTFTEVDLAGLINEIAESLKPMASKTNHSLTVSIQPGIPPVTIDRDRIKDVLENLIDNAFRYAKDGTEVTITASSNENQAIVSVSDTGSGIPAHERSKLFDKFYRGNKAATDSSGSGLGLYISRRTAREHGGDLTLDESYTRGASFVLTLPLSTNPQEAA